MNPSSIELNNVKGKFADLQMSMGIAIVKDDMSTFVELFEYSNHEMYELDRLVAGSGKEDQTKKKYKHVCNLIDLAYSLCMCPSSNLTQKFHVHGSYSMSNVNIVYYYNS